MPFMIWEDRYSVDPTMDLEHRKFFEMLNRLHEAMQSGSGRQLYDKILLELASYTRSHFRSEEAMLARRGYPELPGHQQLHRRFTARVQELENKLAAGERVLSIELLEFLRDWLSDHILGADARYGVWLKAHSN